MKTYLIKVFVAEYIISNWENDLEWQKQFDNNEEEIAYLEETLNKLYKWSSKCVEVSSLEEYFALIEEISDICDRDYRIYNNGRSIVMGE